MSIVIKKKSIFFAPQQISRLYLENAVAIWNGNGLNGNNNIQDFILKLPSTSHRVLTFDAQPIVNEIAPNQNAIMILVCGKVQHFNSTTNGHYFQQTFVIYAQEDKWKIASDCFRIQDALCSQNV